MKRHHPLSAWLCREGRKRRWLALQLGVDPSLIAHWIAGRREPSQRHKAAIAIVTENEVSEKSWNCDHTKPTR